MRVVGFSSSTMLVVLVVFFLCVFWGGCVGFLFGHGGI